MTKAELLFIPAPGIGHLASAMEMAKLLVNRDERLFITLGILKLPFDSKASTQTDDTSRIRYVDLPNDNSSPEPNSSFSFAFLDALVESKKTHVRDIAAGITGLAGLVVDMFCTNMIDVADEFGVPSYIFFTSSAASLGLMFHLQSLQDDQNQDITELFKGSGAELSVPSFSNSVPAKVLASVLLENKSECKILLGHPRRFRKTKGIMVNTFTELESHAVKSLSDSDGNIPPVYPVGPVLKLEGGEGTQQQDVIMSWLDHQPPSSVVFLCFGSLGCFGEAQVKEIAHALEHSGHRFLWSLRQPPPKGMGLPGEYTNPYEVLPEGFLERTAVMGKVIGWAPQVAVLAHPAVGGFVSHCGWNSTLESVWCGVPMAAWPLYAEQQQNAFEMVRELGLAVEIKIDYRMNSDQPVLAAKEIESRIRLLMMEDGEIRKKVKEMKEKSRESMMEGGSSYISLGHLIQDVCD